MPNPEGYPGTWQESRPAPGNNPSHSTVNLGTGCAQRPGKTGPLATRCSRNGGALTKPAERPRAPNSRDSRAGHTCPGLNLSPPVCPRNPKAHVPAVPTNLPHSASSRDTEDPGQLVKPRWTREARQGLKLFFGKKDQETSQTQGWAPRSTTFFSACQYSCPLTK